jgi:hypothetical protein
LLGFAGAKQVEIGSVQNKDVHFLSIRCTPALGPVAVAIPFASSATFWS